MTKVFYTLGVFFTAAAIGLAAYAQSPESLKADTAALAAAIDPANGPPRREPIFDTPANYMELGPPGPYWPAEAERRGVSGAAVLQCKVAASGILNGCRVLAEGPHSYGFGIASIKMAERGYLKVTPVTGAQDGDSGRILVLFRNRHIHG